MKTLNYLIFHPEIQREKVEVRATVQIGDSVQNGWVGEIWVDKIGNGNEDPFVFNNPWLYSYCHATQLRRRPNRIGYVQDGSTLIFVSGDFANKMTLKVDTVFHVGECQEWKQNPLDLPDKYESLRSDHNSPLWQRHLRFPFKGIHSTVKYTYEAQLWQEGQNTREYSYLPLIASGQRIEIPFTSIEEDLRRKIMYSVSGKIPLIILDDELEEINDLMARVTKVKVLKNIKSVQEPTIGFSDDRC